MMVVSQKMNRDWTKWETNRDEIALLQNHSTQCELYYSNIDGADKLEKYKSNERIFLPSLIDCSSLMMAVQLPVQQCRQQLLWKKNVHRSRCSTLLDLFQQ